MSASTEVLWALAHELRSPIGIVRGVVAHGLEDEELSRLAHQGTLGLEHLCRCLEALATRPDRFESISVRRGLEEARQELEALEPRRAARLQWQSTDADLSAWGPPSSVTCGFVQLLSQVIRMDEGPFTLTVTDALELRGPAGALAIPSPESGASRSTLAAALFEPITEAFSLEEEGALLRWRPRSKP